MPPGGTGGFVETTPYTPGSQGPLKKGVQWVKTHPWITAGIVATAIAVPIAVSEIEADPAS
jgi:hypothetical protein